MSFPEIISSVIITINSFVFVQKPPEVLGVSTSFVTQIDPKTISSFIQKEETEEEPIPYLVKEKNDPDLETGKTEVLEKGVDGKIIKKYLITFWQEGESDKTLIETTREEPIPEVVSVGTKVVWKEIDTPEGTRKYWKSIPNVRATSYDRNCEGCDEWTALGTRLDVGTCAVDPKVIKMWTEIFVPGYGLCRALDVGGAIKGNKIDVGFYDLPTQAPEVGWLGTHYTDIYLLDQPPE